MSKQFEFNRNAYGFVNLNSKINLFVKKKENVIINVLKNLQEDAVKGGAENEGDWLHFLRSKSENLPKWFLANTD